MFSAVFKGLLPSNPVGGLDSFLRPAEASRDHMRPLWASECLKWAKQCDIMASLGLIMPYKAMKMSIPVFAEKRGIVLFCLYYGALCIWGIMRSAKAVHDHVWPLQVSKTPLDLTGALLYFGSTGSRWAHPRGAYVFSIHRCSNLQVLNPWIMRACCI